jgi:two-component system, LuxR family, response regulator FixJ
MNVHHPVYIVDDDAAVRRSTKFILDNARWPARCYASGDAFLKEARKLPPGCVLLDIRMPGLNGLAVHQLLKKLGLAFPVIIITGHGDVSLAVRAMKEGAVDFLEKPFRREDLLAALEQGCRFLIDGKHHRRSAAEARDRINALTEREKEVMSCLADGLANKAIAIELGISPRTVEVHRANLMEKLEAQSLSEVLKLAFAADLPDGEQG